MILKPQAIIFDLDGVITDTAHSCIFWPGGR